MSFDTYRPTRKRPAKETTADERMTAEIAEYEATGGKLDLPGRNEIILKTPLGDSSTRPTNARDKVSFNERREFAAAPATPTTADEMKAARIRKKVEGISVEWQNWFRDCVSKGLSLQTEWQRLGHEGRCGFLNGFVLFPGDVDPAVYFSGEAQRAAMIEFADSSMFAKWREHKRSNEQRFEFMLDVVERVQKFLHTNLIDARNVSNYRIAFTMLSLAGFIPNPMPPVAEPEPEQLSAAEQHVIDRQNYCTVIVGNDEHGVDYTEEMLDALPAKEGLRLRRLIEKGNRGDSRFDMFLAMKDDVSRIRAKLNAEVLA